MVSELYFENVNRPYRQLFKYFYNKQYFILFLNGAYYYYSDDHSRLNRESPKVSRRRTLENCWCATFSFIALTLSVE